MKEQARAKARQLAQEFVQRGDATGWFERLYTQAQGKEALTLSKLTLVRVISDIY